jgi:hypothetical protein
MASASTGPTALMADRSITTDSTGTDCPPALWPVPRNVSFEPEALASPTACATSRAEVGPITPSGLPRNTWPKSAATAASAAADRSIGTAVQPTMFTPLAMSTFGGPTVTA